MLTQRPRWDAVRVVGVTKEHTLSNNSGAMKEHSKTPRCNL